MLGSFSINLIINIVFAEMLLYFQKSIQPSIFWCWPIVSDFWPMADTIMSITFQIVFMVACSIFGFDY